MNASAASILVLDDEPDLRTLYELTLLREGYRVATAGTLQEARAQLQTQRFDVVISDMRLPDGFGMELLQELRAQQRSERCIVMTAYGSAENAVEALRSGAFDYLTKPVDPKQFRLVVASAVQGSGGMWATHNAARSPQARPSHDKPDCPDNANDALARLVGTSEVMRHVKQRVLKIAHSMAPVLVRGESGTGKELVAQALHASSQRAKGPLIAVNCGAIPENLLEAEFFGARKGAYTGATQDRPGYFQAAQGGTLFLDEIGDLPLAMQTKLLRAIQERSVRPIGSTQEENVDVRIISATHRDLAEEVQSGRFRQDLYYRLNVIEIVIPPLRERREDLPALCTALLDRIAHESGLVAPALTPAALAAIATQPLKGNVRELENLLHRAVALSDGETLQLECAAPADTPPATRTTAAAPLSSSPPAAPGQRPPAGAPSDSGALADADLPHDLQAWLDQQERDILVRALHAAGFNRTATAARLGISLRQIRYRIARLNIAAPQDTEPHADTEH
ncbi:sigma-54-dependent transcriptional regulator [Simplicispira psychrophila]|uniref:sigma-54-dependent transcriptional regulator n=1 Tax=Simplicispira psychrophila TaxID=80882 RepID=UPI00048370AD|nr:sigma-54 dependent transcriptional regulator [Simplicispira psychrophila]